MLGTVQDGVVGAVRNSVITREKGQQVHKMERYGPYLFMITNQNKQRIYAELFQAIYGTPAPKDSAPDNYKMIDRVSNLLERYIQLQIIRRHTESHILLDGSLIGDTIANPGYYIDRMLNDSYRNGNVLIAVSKFTNLILSNNRRSILSLRK